MGIDIGELLTAKHKDLYMERYLKANIPISGLCFNNRLAWGLEKYYYFNILEDLVCLYCEGDKELVSKHLVLPIGALDETSLQRIVDYYYAEFQKDGLPLKLMYVPDGHLNIVQKLKGYDVKVIHKRDFDEYVYDADSLRKLSGKALKSKKNLFNRFRRECNMCEYSSITADDMEDCLKLTEEWCLDRGVDPLDVRNSDYIPIKILFENFKKLSLRGGVIRLMKKVIAFSLGSDPIRDTAFIHFEKADKTINGTNVVVASEVIRHEYPDVKFVNREEDMGIEGLRIAKESYNPISMTRKNDVLLMAKD